MKVSIFIDGQNFYRALLRYDETLRVDYDRLATWMTQQVGGPGGTFSGAYYYVGVSPDAPAMVEGFLRGLEVRPGYFVRREVRVRRSGRCTTCGAEYEYTTEKRVDTRLVADLIQYAAIGAFDAAVLVSGDADFVPAVEAVNRLGRQVWVATWSAEELSNDLRILCFGQLRLGEGVAAFRAERARSERVPFALRNDGGRPPAGAWRGPRLPAAVTLDQALQELQRAETRLPHVSRGYFVTRWRSHQLPPVGQEREQLVQQLLDAGLAEEFEFTDGEGRVVRALRSRLRPAAAEPAPEEPTPEEPAAEPEPPGA